jgi:L-fucose isomerase
MTAQFIDENHVSGDGKKPHIVVADEPIKDTSSAMRVGNYFSEQGVRVAVGYSDVWAYPGELDGLLLQNLSMGQVPLLQLSGNSAAWPGVVYNFAVTGMEAQMGYLSHRIIGDVDEDTGEFSDELKEDLIDWIAAAVTFADMWGTPYAAFGGASMNMETGMIHRITARRYFGINTIDIDMIEIEKRIEKEGYDVKEADQLFDWVSDIMGDRILYDKATGTEENLRYQLKMYLVMRDIMNELGATVGGFQGQRQWTDYLPTGDIPEAMLNDNFDHTGKKPSIAFATENDFNAGLTQRINVGLSGGLPAIFMDFRKAYIKEGFVDFCNSGNHPPFYAGLNQENPEENYKHVRFHPAIESYFPGGGFSNEFRAAETDMTFDRLLTRPDGVPVLQAAEGKSILLDDKRAREVEEASNETWPHLFGTFDEDLRVVAATWGCNHAVGMPGRLKRRVQYWADITRVPIIGYENFQKGGRTEPLLYQMYGGGVEARVQIGPRM